MSKFLLYFAKIVPLIGPVCAAIEGLVTEAKSGTSKKQMALDSLQVATAVAKTIDPADTAAVSAANTLASVVIDSTVAIQNAMKGK